MNAWLLRVLHENPHGRRHPLLLGLLRAYCPAAAHWFHAGAEVPRPFHPVWQALEDYATQPNKTLRDFLDEYGVGKLRGEAKRYIEKVRAARQRFPYLKAPELLPTFRGAEIPLQQRFGIQRELEAMGGPEGFFAYVRTWAFLVTDWAAAFPFPNLRAWWGAFPVHFRGLKRPIRLPTPYWSEADATDGESPPPRVLGVPADAPAALQALYLFARSPGRVPWPHEPQVWLLHLDGTATPLDPVVRVEAQVQALLQWGEAAAVRAPVRALASPTDCDACPFVGVCFREPARPRAWTPQAAAGWRLT